MLDTPTDGRALFSNLVKNSVEQSFYVVNVIQRPLAHLLFVTTAQFNQFLEHSCDIIIGNLVPPLGNSGKRFLHPLAGVFHLLVGHAELSACLTQLLLNLLPIAVFNQQAQLLFKRSILHLVFQRLADIARTHHLVNQLFQRLLELVKTFQRATKPCVGIIQLLYVFVNVIIKEETVNLSALERPIVIPMGFSPITKRTCFYQLCRFILIVQRLSVRFRNIAHCLGKDVVLFIQTPCLAQLLIECLRVRLRVGKHLLHLFHAVLQGNGVFRLSFAVYLLLHLAQIRHARLDDVLHLIGLFLYLARPLAVGHIHLGSCHQTECCPRARANTHKGIFQ